MSVQDRVTQYVVAIIRSKYDERFVGESPSSIAREIADLEFHVWKELQNNEAVFLKIAKEKIAK